MDEAAATIIQYNQLHKVQVILAGISFCWVDSFIFRLALFVVIICNETCHLLAHYRINYFVLNKIYMKSFFNGNIVSCKCHTFGCPWATRTNWIYWLDISVSDDGDRSQSNRETRAVLRKYLICRMVHTNKSSLEYGNVVPGMISSAYNTRTLS